MPGDTLYVKSIAISNDNPTSHFSVGPNMYIEDDGTIVIQGGGDPTPMILSGNTGNPQGLSLGANTLYLNGTIVATSNNSNMLSLSQVGLSVVNEDGFLGSNCGSAPYTITIGPLGSGINESGNVLSYISNLHTFNRNVGIQNTNSQHALTIGSPSNVYVDTINNQTHIEGDLYVKGNFVHKSPVRYADFELNSENGSGITINVTGVSIVELLAKSTVSVNSAYIILNTNVTNAIENVLFSPRWQTTSSPTYEYNAVFFIERNTNTSVLIKIKFIDILHGTFTHLPSNYNAYLFIKMEVLA